MFLLADFLSLKAFLFKSIHIECHKKTYEKVKCCVKLHTILIKRLRRIRVCHFHVHIHEYLKRNARIQNIVLSEMSSQCPNINFKVLLGLLPVLSDPEFSNFNKILLRMTLERTTLHWEVFFNRKVTFFKTVLDQ